VLFFYYLIADATYDGTYSDWYFNDIEGLKEYYFDDKNYASAISQIEATINEKYTVTTISLDDYVKYLSATNLEGKFDGDLDSVSPSGMKWSEYLNKLGYSDDIAALEKKPSAESVLQLVAKAEAEKNPLAYNPESWYREQLYGSYISRNYSDGINVSEITGIKKINDYTCTVLFNSKNINAISELNVPIVSKAFYSSEYIKGSAEKIKEIEGFPVCSGPYVLADYDRGEASLFSNQFYNQEKSDFSRLKFIDLGADENDAVNSVISGKVDIISVLADADAVNKLSNESVSYFLSDCDHYVSMFFNTRTLTDSITRKALMGLFSAGDVIESNIGSYYTGLFSPISVRFSEYPSKITSPYYNESAYTAYSMMGYSGLKNVSAYYCGTESDIEYKILNEYKSKLSEKGITLDIILSDETVLENAIASGQADLWIEKVYDGATCDKYDYYNSSGFMNKTALNSAEINSMTSGIRSAVGFSDKAQMTEQLMGMVMEEAVELPIYQRQMVTVFNNETVNPDSVSDNSSYDSFTYLIPYLKSN
ncbi:MAG: hypothetical protein IJ264_03950, partial [Clostridia bacterium]|nr:hypothetical protein [Clostridia bacterium]